jgi:Flp pilus assembly protein TadD
MACLLGLLFGQLIPGADAAEQGRVLSTEGKVEFARQKAAWSAATVNQSLEPQDRLRTLAVSRAMVQLVELGRVRLDELTTLEILPPRNTKSKGTLDLKAGAMYFFTRDRPREFEIQTPQALAASRGTEFLVALEPDGRELFVVYDGEVELTNTLGSVVVKPGEQGIVEPGQPPRKTAVIQSRRIVQWWLYYPAVLDPTELALTAAQKEVLAKSLDAYRQGDLLQAVQDFPEGRTPENDDERVFHAALLLSVGQVEQAGSLLATTNSSSSAAHALRLMMDTIQMRDVQPLPDPQTATEWLANSYVLQSRFDLAAALAAARKATGVTPQFGFAFARVAELEFSFGHTAEASDALVWALSLSPHNAQAWALKGFLLSAQSHWHPAEAAFAKAIALDPALGNGWLGRGLVRIRLGDKAEGRRDLQTAAAMEPNRSGLRSYLGKGFDYTHDEANAARELNLAKELDSRDPTPWLYSALILRQNLRYNEAVTDLEKSVALNDDRRVYRSRLLLDQDQAVRSASLATIYRGAGMDDVSVREAARAVANDYANYSAHQFLAESFDALRDPTRFNLRTETAWFNELLLANMLSPVGGGSLSQNISQQEYSRLFEADRLGFSSATEYRSDGQVRELASQFGTVGNFSYALDLDYQHNDGVRPNNELDRLEWYTTAKYQLTAQDSLFLLTKYQNYKSGDNFQYYDPTAVRSNYEIYGVTNMPVVRTNFSFEEYQKPIALLGYHREWSPGVHTLLLGGRLENDQRFSNTASEQLILTRSSNSSPSAVSSQIFDVNYRSVFEIYTCELNQIFQTDRQLFVLGGRYQTGTFETQDQITFVNPSQFPFVNTNLGPYFNNPPAQNDVTADFERISGYGYYTWEIIRNLHLTGGLAYDRITAPANYRYPPVSAGSTAQDQLSPKAALVWSPRPEVTVRGVYTRSLGGVSLDESYRLEPAQLAGFSQTFRTVIPESVVGSVSAPSYETAGVALDLKFKTRTYFGVQAEFLKSEVTRQIGVFDYNGSFPPPPPITPSATTQELDYKEPAVSVTLNQLLSDYWSVGAQYRFTHSSLHAELPEIPTSIYPSADQTQQADLQQARLFLLMNHPSGFFGRFEALWFHQQNSGYTPALPGDDFVQLNLMVGYRLRRQHGEISLGVLNLTDTDYHLNPLNAYTELPRERVFVARLKINF